MSITVGQPNHPPTVTNPGAQASSEGQVVSLQISANDLDLDPLTYAAVGLPDGLSIHPSTGLIAGTISYHAAANSPYNVTVTVSDGKGGSTPVSFTWTVGEARSGLCENDSTLVGCWPMEEGSGTMVIDATANGNDGTLVNDGGTMWVADRFGNAGKALHFDGTNQYVKVPDASSLHITGDITIAAWVKPEEVKTQDVVKKAVTTGTYVQGYELALSSASGNCAVSGGTVPCGFSRFNATSAAPDTYRIDTKATYSATDPWTLYAVTYTAEDTTLRIYKNGTLDNSRVVSELTIASNSLFLGFGAQLAGTGPTASRFFHGSLDDIRIYSRALNLQQIETLAGVNRTPVLNAIGNKAVDELAPLTFTATASDLDSGDALSFSLDAAAPTGASIHPTTGAFTWTPAEDQGPGSYPVTVKVCDNGTPVKCDEEAITVTVDEVNVAPVLDAIGNKSMAEGNELSFTAMASDADLPANTLTFSLVNGTSGSVPEGAAITTGGAFTWTPTEAQGAGSYTFDVCVSDSALSDCETITVTVSEVNVAPVLGAIGNKVVAEQAPLSFTATASDADLPAQTLTFSLADGTGAVPAGAAITTGGAFTWTPTEVQGPGSYTFDVCVSDSALSDCETITVTVSEVNVAPVLGAIGNKAVAEQAPLSFTATASDADLPAQTLTFSLADGTGAVPAGAAITTGGAFTWTPTEAQGAGSYTFDVCVSDSALSDCETITVSVSEANVAPVLAAIGNKAVAEQALLSFTATASDADLPAQTLTFSLADGTGAVPAGAAITVGGAFTWTPTEAQGAGSYTFDVCVSDSALANCETITVTVSEVNVAPVLDAIDDQFVEELTRLSFTATASDADVPAQTLTFSLGAGAPTGAAIDPITGVFTWTPADYQVYYFTFIVCVSDGQLTDCQIINVDVADVRPSVTFEKLVDITILPEPGGDFNFTLRITNTSVEPVLITALTDDNLPTNSFPEYVDVHTLAIGEVLDILYTVSHTDAMTYYNTASVTVQDNEGTPVSAEATQTIEVTDVLPSVTLAKSVDVLSLPEPGGVFNFTLTITNNSPETVWITELTDTNTTSLSDECLSMVSDNPPYTDYGLIPAGESVSCMYSVMHTEAGTYNNTASVKVIDNELNEASASDSQSVTVLAPLTVSKTGSGSGTVTSAPAGIDCGTTCSYAFVKNAVVTLTATPTEGSAFTGWSGAGCSGIGTCSVTMDTAKAVTATFADTTPPDTTIDSYPSDPVGSASASFSFSSSEAGSTFECQLDGGGFSACTNPKAYTGLSDGSHTFRVRATDAASNTDPTPASYTWTVDTAAPETTITANPPDPSASASASFSFSSSEAGSTFECQLDSGGFSACTNPKAYTGLSDGSHTFQVRATDAASNVDATPATYAWMIDRTAPVLTIAGFTADGTPMAVGGGGGYILPTTNVGTINHEVQFEAGSTSSEPLAGLTGLYLNPAGVDVAGLTAYYMARIPDGSPAEALAYRAYLIAALDGATHPFAYVTTDGSNKLVLHDAAQYDLAGNLTVGMIVPDDYPLGTYPVQGTARDAGGNGAAVSLSLIVTGDRTAPVLTIAGFTADGNSMAVGGGGGYILPTTNVGTINHEVQFEAGSTSSEPLAGLTGLYLNPAGVDVAGLTAYYMARIPDGSPAEALAYRAYLIAALDGVTHPFAYITTDGSNKLVLHDAAQYDLAGNLTVGMIVPDDYPLGTYPVQGTARDAGGNGAAVSLSLIVTGDRTAPVLTIAGFTADGNSMAVGGGGGYILPTTNVGTINHEIRFAAGSTSSEPLAGLTGLYLNPAGVDVAGLTAYYMARIPDGSPAEALAYRAYLIAALDGATHPFAYVTTDGSNKLVLHDAAQYDLAGNLTVGMIVPDDYPLGTYPVQGTARDAGGNGAAVSLSLIVTGDRTAPTLDITGATADGDTAMAGDPENGYTLPTTNDPADDWLIQFAAGTSASEALANVYFGLYLTDSTVSADFLKAYYTWKGVPEPYLTYLKDAADSTNPFVYIRGSTVTLVDAAKRDLQAVDDPMTVPDTFPSGTYTVRGVIRDLAGNETTVTLILKVAGPAPSAPNAPAVSIVKLGSDVQLSWPAVQTDTNDNFIVVTTYQVFRSSVPYFTPDPTPGTGNLEYEGPNLTYLHDEAAGSVGMYFYIVRAVNSVGPSANSRRVGVFTFQLVPGQ